MFPRSKVCYLIVGLFFVFLFLSPSFSSLGKIPFANAASSSGTLPTAAGYEVTGAAGSLTRIKGSWIVPAVSCASGETSSSNISVVLDGLSGSTDGAYIGTVSGCSNGKPAYYAYVNFYPAAHNQFQKLSLTINPGDKVEAQEKWSAGSHGWRSQFIDETTTVKVKTSAKAPSSFSGPTLNTASFLVGMASKEKLSNYGTAELGFDFTSVSATCIVSAANVGSSATLSSLAANPSYNVIQLTQISKIDTMAIPNPISADGTSFTVTWQHST
jgi:hypothetical protein